MFFKPMPVSTVAAHLIRVCSVADTIPLAISTVNNNTLQVQRQRLQQLPQSFRAHPPARRTFCTMSPPNRLQFAANLNFLFAENGASVLERFRRASAAGFRAVECSFGLDVCVADAKAVQLETGLKVVLLNLCVGTESGGEFGCTAVPGLETSFDANLKRTLEFATALSCNKIHLMAGKVTGGVRTDQHRRTYERNLRSAVALLEPAGIVATIEPICQYGVPDYYLNNYEMAVEMIKLIGSPALRLQLDLYHLQHIDGNVTYRMRELMPLVGHVQIAQVPHRHEPHTLGELNYAYVLQVLEESEYVGDWIGLEYRPALETTVGLGQWLSKYGYAL